MSQRRRTSGGGETERTIPTAAINKRHWLRWRKGDLCIEQDAIVLPADRPDLFPAGPSWARLAIGPMVVFIDCPVL